MDNDKRLLILHLIDLESKIGRLYSRFGEMIPSDGVFWKKLAAEEENHATLLKTKMEYLVEMPEFTTTLLASDVETIRNLTDHLDALINNLNADSLTSTDALHIALQLETSAGEWHFHQTQKSSAGLPGDIFRSLSDGDKDHAQRIIGHLSRRA